VPGDVAASLLVTAIRHQHDDFKMPPKGRLPAAVVADLVEWVKRGAPDPRNAPATVAAADWDQVLRERRRWWSLQPVQKSPPPSVRDTGWSSHPVDRHILARLEQAGLHPASEADPRTLMRRLTLVLTGLPPTASEVDAFVQSAIRNPQAAIEETVDRLLASPHFGERWARHWLDVVRFSETHGNEWNYEVHHAWRYRDYLIRAFNDDVPFDQVVREHIAGDLVAPRWNRAGRFNESVIGTAFYRFGEVNHDDCIEFRQIGYDLADNQIDTLTKAFQATTVACARCHDHKLDAVSMKDYYALLGILRSSRLVSHTIDAADVNAEPKKLLHALKAEIRAELASLWRAEIERLDRNALSGVKIKGEPPLEHLLHPWHAVAGRGWMTVAEAWQQLAQKYAKEQQDRANFNLASFTPLDLSSWRRTGQGLADGPAVSGDFAVTGAGDAALTGIYPVGIYSHLLSERLNGALRSAVLPARKYVSVHVLGAKTSAVRLVSNNCQLNYVNYKALTRPELEWKRFAIPADRETLQTYAELMTKFDNPKFPDQLGTLGADTTNSRVPWHEAAADPCSYFGIAGAVIHDSVESPRPELGHLLRLFSAEAAGEVDVVARYAQVAGAAVAAWGAGHADDNDVRWLDGLLRLGLLSNKRTATPRLEALLAQYRTIEAELALPRIAPGLADSDSGYDQPVLARGDSKKPGAAVPRRYLEVLDQPPLEMQPRGSGRRELAERIAAPDNPLTARVLVNRLWHHLFGNGLVRTVDDFGHVGELPSHPELLDYLAARFVEEGWSIKKMLRLLVLSHTFRQASRPAENARVVDPENRLLHHYPARRLEAEAIRDAILAASGRLDRTLFGPSIHPYRDKVNADRRLFPGPLDGAGRRSIYIKANLMEAPPFLGAFNAPGGKVTQGRRDTTNVPAQALALLNDPFVLQQADVWAERLVARADTSAATRIDHLFQTALGRPPKTDESERFLDAAMTLARLHGVDSPQLLSARAVWADLAQTMFNLKEFIYIP
jgi:hypothetical protein